MKRNIAKKWIEALRSGKYNQGQGCLTRVALDGKEYYCCLGVLCVILEVPRRWDDIDMCMSYGEGYEHAGYLPPEAMKKAGMCTKTGAYGGRATLTDLNDDGKSFGEIADVIEANTDNL